MGCHVLLQGIFPTQGSNPGLLHWQADSLPLSQQGSQRGLQGAKCSVCSFSFPGPVETQGSLAVFPRAGPITGFLPKVQHHCLHPNPSLTALPCHLGTPNLIPPSHP